MKRPEDIPEVDLSFINEGFYTRIAVSAFEQFLKHGVGAYFFKETADIDYKRDLIEDYIRYIPLTKKTAVKYPVKALIMVVKYDPKVELIFVSQYKDGKVEVRKMGNNVLPIRPIDAFREWSAANGKGRFIQGELLRLKKPIGDIQAGHYVFVKRAGVSMELRALINGRICKKVVRVHSDFEEWFKGSGGIVRVR